MPSKVASELLDFDMDRYVNPWLPHNRVGRLPAPISRFLGYRKNTYKEPPALVQWFSAFVGAFIGILIVGAIFKYAPGVTNHHPPVIVASLGASAILDYSAIRSPVAQPRNSVLGQGLSAIVGMAIGKLFMLNPNFQDIQWIAGAMACACASLVMCMTNTVHPPGGATAVIATTQATVISMGWWYVPVTILGAVVMLVVALLWNNLLRQFPVFWWTPAEVGGKWAKSDEKDEEKAVEEKADRQDSNTSRYVLYLS
jgi:CBS-domain-containing membrane protein